jgi:hypothetical protein
MLQLVILLYLSIIIVHVKSLVFGHNCKVLRSSHRADENRPPVAIASHHNIFQGHPEIRKITISYILNCIHDESLHSKVYCERTRLAQLLKLILPPSSAEVVDNEIESIMEHFDHQYSLSEREFISTAVLDNHLWEKAGMTAVKELIFTHCRASSILRNMPLLSDHCMELLEVSYIPNPNTFIMTY